MLNALSPGSWTADHCAHLLARAGFGGTPRMVRDLHKLGLRKSVELVLDGGEDAADLSAPEWTASPIPAFREMRMESQPETDAELQKIRMQASVEDRNRMRELRTWWLRRMRYGGWPLREKMTLFWHGHFATSNQKVQFPQAMWRQNELFRAHALGRFRDLLAGVSRDPAMIRWLDLNRSSRKQPNENFGRELLELFTLGEGHYAEEDIKAAARAFTGYRISPDTGDFTLAKRACDRDEKTFMGHSGNFSGDDIVDIILEQPQCANFLAGRLWEFFAHGSPSDEVVTAAANSLRRTGYDLRLFLRELFSSEEFYSGRAMRNLIKSPVQWLVQSSIALETDLPGQPDLDTMLSQLGQIPFVPPNVRGWEGGRSWISSTTLVIRYNLAAYMTGLGGPTDRRPAALRSPPLNLSQLVPRSVRRNPASIADALVFRLFGTMDFPRMRDRAIALLGPEPPTDETLRHAIRNLMSTPDFQIT